MRLAWFSPWPPQPSGIAACSADVVPALVSRGHAIDVFVDAAQVPAVRGPDGAAQPGELRVLSAHDFVWRQARGQYDLPIYQVGNSRTHEFIWPYLFRWPGLAVLHDARLHHARAAALLSRRLHSAYRDEFTWNHPDVTPGLAELGLHGFAGTYYYQWPMRRTVMESSRLVATHAPGLVETLREEHPGRPVTHIALGHGRANLDIVASRRRFRAARGLPEAAPVFGVFGGLTAEKRVPQILRAFAATRQWAPGARLLLVGAPDPALHLMEDAGELGVADAVCLIEAATDGEFDDAIAASDVAITMRWPTALETSGPWLRALAARRATMVVDLEHQRQVPSLDPRTWRRHAPTDDLEAGADARAITVAIDILDEAHSLRLAMRRLATDASLRERLGSAGRQYWESAHTITHMVTDYERAISEALASPVPTPSLPAHLRADGSGHARTLLEPFDITLPI